MIIIFGLATLLRPNKWDGDRFYNILKHVSLKIAIIVGLSVYQMENVENPDLKMKMT